MMNHRIRAAAVVGCIIALATASATLADEFSVTGTVLSPDGQPVAGATVFGAWYFWQAPAGASRVEAETTSAEDGTFTLHIVGEGSPPDKYKQAVGALKDGFGLGWTQVSVHEPAGITITLNEETVVTGVVKDEQGEPIPAAEIYVNDARGDDERDRIYPGKRFKATTGDDGRFRIPRMPAGKVVDLFVNADGFVRQDFGNKPAEQIHDVELTLLPAAVITGKITRDGQPVEGVYVICEGLEFGHSRGGGVSDKDGIYVADSMPPGTYNVHISPNTPGPAVHGRTAAAHRMVTCKVGEPATGIDFELVEGGLVTGAILDDATGQPVPRASVTAYASEADFPYSGFWHAGTDGQGYYSLRLPPGEYWLQATAGGYKYRGKQPWLHEVQVAEGQTVANLDMRLTPEPQVGGVVVDPEGNPVAGAYVRAVGHLWGDVVTEEDGRFQVKVGYDGLPTEVFAGHKDTGLAGRTVVAEATDNARIVLEPGAHVTGRVLDPDGNGVGGVKVAAHYRTKPNIPHSLPRIRLPGVTADDNGAFRIGPLPSDVDLLIYVKGEDGRYISDRIWPETVSLRPGEERDFGPTTLDRQGRKLVGRVMDAERELVPGCVVLEVQNKIITRADELGAFQLSGIPYLDYDSVPGQFYEATVLAIHPRLPLFAGEQRIDPDWGFELNMVLEPLGAIKGRLLGDDGQPIPDFVVELSARDLPSMPWPSDIAQYQRGAQLMSKTVTDQDGRWHFDGLIPGFRYSVWARDTQRQLTLFSESIDTEPGETINLDDIDKNEPQ